MRFATSCSKTLIRSDWRRFWPIGFLYALISFFMLPLPVWVNRELTDGGALWGSRRAAQVVREMSPGFVILAFFFGLILAMAVYGYQMNGKSVGLMHALPVTRRRMFFSHFAAALSMLTAANCLTFLLTLLMKALANSVEIRSLLVWLAVTELAGFFFLAFASLCAVITGWLLAVPVIYLGFNFVVWAYWMILNGLADLLYRHYSGNGTFTGSLVEWLTPVVRLFRVTTERAFTVVERGLVYTDYGYSPALLSTLLIYAALGAAMLCLAWLLYRRRRSETAGDAVAFRPLRLVARYVISIAAGLALGTMVHQMVSWNSDNVVSLILWQVVMGGLVYCAVEMLLRKSFRIFDRRTAVGLLALWLVLVGTCLTMKWDLLGVERRVPAAERVEGAEVYLSGVIMSDTELRDEASVRAAVALHQLLVDRGDADVGESSFRVTYHLSGGTVMQRQYQLDLDDPAVRAAAEELVNRPEIRQSLILEDQGKYGDKFTGGYAVNFLNGKELMLTPDQCLALYRAAEEDAKRPVTLGGSVYTDFEVELNTTEGTYRLWRIRQDCNETLRTLEEIGLIDRNSQAVEEPAVHEAPVTSVGR